MKTFIIFALLSVGLSSIAEAKLLHIIHTNDLHSMFQGTRQGLGGYARLKTVVDELRRKTESQGIRTLYMDAGDFGEGSSFYFSNNGVDSLRALDLLGVDIAVVGNHDFILGGRELRNQMREANLKASIISGNIKGKRWLGLRKMVPAHKDFDLDGLKMRVIGLTTAELHYQYPFRPLGWISSSVKSGLKLEKKAQKEGVDFLVALTHIGLTKDIELVTKSSNIDLVVGGHSHTFVPRPEMTKNALGRIIPVLQVGAHSMYVGSLVIDVQPNGASTIIDYQTYDITKKIPEEAVMKDFVDQAYMTREEYFGRKWSEVIGSTEIPLTGYENGLQTGKRSCWSQHIARLTRLAANSHLGFQFDDFQGEHIAPGPVTFGDMVDNFPHFRKWGDRGWRVKKAWVQGFILKKLLKTVAGTAYANYITIDGMQSKQENKELESFDLVKHPLDSALIRGLPISNLKYYSVALPSEVPHALMRIFNVFGYLIFNIPYIVPGTHYWELLEDYIRENSPIRCIDSSELLGPKEDEGTSIVDNNAVITEDLLETSVLGPGVEDDSTGTER
jgi:5'-nucleotidase/UDP-sugar diphosphatase